MSEAAGDVVLEIVAWVHHAEDTVLTLNRFLTDCEFVRVGIQELERSYGRVFRMPKEYQRSGSVQFPSGETCSLEFREAIMNSGAGFDILTQGYAVLLRMREPAKLSIRAGEMHIPFERVSTFQAIIARVLRALRLTSAGDIAMPGIFAIRRPGNDVIVFSGTVTARSSNMRFSVNTGDAERFEKILASLPDEHWPFAVALANFESAYLIGDPRSRFIMLVTALESIFNVGRDQIAHTIARHLALLLASDAAEFEATYRQIKETYAMRSAIVHGRVEKITSDRIRETEQWVRAALLFCMNHSYTQKTLFEYLNRCGY
jgi:hypothetical protein